MSRSGYVDDCWDDDANWRMICWRGAVKSAIRGKRGQAFLKEMLASLDDMQTKVLIHEQLIDTNYISCSHWGLYECTMVCAIGSVGQKRNIDLESLDPYDYSTIANRFEITEALAREIMWANDEWSKETPEHRYQRMRGWIESQIKK